MRLTHVTQREFERAQERLSNLQCGVLVCPDMSPPYICLAPPQGDSPWGAPCALSNQRICARGSHPWTPGKPPEEYMRHHSMYNHQIQEVGHYIEIGIGPMNNISRRKQIGSPSAASCSPMNRMLKTWPSQRQGKRPELDNSTELHQCPYTPRPTPYRNSSGTVCIHHGNTRHLYCTDLRLCTPSRSNRQ